MNYNNNKKLRIAIPCRVHHDNKNLISNPKKQEFQKASSVLVVLPPYLNVSKGKKPSQLKCIR